jgi:ADP-ribose pyrophosphatase
VHLKRRRLACRNTRFDIFFDHVADQRGAEVENYLVVTPHSLRPDGLAGITVLPVLEDGIVLLESYRHAIGATTLEAARGFIDAGETPAQAAVRELEEEAGLICAPDRLVALGFCAPEAGMIQARVALFAALDCRPAAGARDPEEIGLGHRVHFPFDRLQALRRAMVLEDVTTVIALERYLMLRDTI